MGTGVPLPGLLVTVKAIDKFNHLYLIVICDKGEGVLNLLPMTHFSVLLSSTLFEVKGVRS